MVALLCVSLSAYAQPIDAPVVEGRPAQAFEAGEIVPWKGVCMDDAKVLEVAKRLAYAEAVVTATEGKTIVSTPLLVSGMVAAVVVSLAIGGAVAYAAKK